MVTPNTNRMRYARVALIAFALWVGGTFLLIARRGAGPGYGFALDTRTAGIVGIVVLLQVGLVLAIWLAGSWALFDPHQAWRRRTWVAVSPSVIFILLQFSILVVDPPSPHKYFEKTFGAKLPEKVHVTEVAHPTLADPGYVEFAFEGSKESTLLLIEAMELTAIEPGPPAFSFRVGGNWALHEWQSAKQFTRVDRSGTGYLLICDPEMLRVVVVREPLYAKSEAENPTGEFSN